MYRVCTDLPSLFHFTVRGYASSSINVIFPIAINTNAIPTFPKLSNPSFLFLSSPPSPSTNRNKRGRRGGGRGKYNNTRRDSTQMRTNRKPETVPRRCFENARRTLGAWKSSRNELKEGGWNFIFGRGRDRANNSHTREKKFPTIYNGHAHAFLGMIPGPSSFPTRLWKKLTLNAP